MNTKTIISVLSLTVGTVIPSSAATLWAVGVDNNAWFYTAANPGSGGGPMANFIQEAGGLNPLGGNPANTGGSGGTRDIDDDYYFSGLYTDVRDGGSYSPVGFVAANEENVERGFTGGDPDMRFHFNLPVSVTTSDLLSVSFDSHFMDSNGLQAIDPLLFWDIEVLMNGVTVGNFNVTRSDIDNTLNPGLAELTTPGFTLADVNGATGAGPDNYVTLRATNVGSSSRWMSLDYIQLDVTPAPEPSSLGLLAFAAGWLLLIRRQR